MIRPTAALLLTVLGAGALGACASSGDMKRVATQVTLMRAETARRDSVQAAQLLEVIVLQQRLADSLAATQLAVRSLRGDIANDLYNVQQQLVQLGELTGQSQRRLSELRTQLEARGAQIANVTAAPTAGDPGSTPSQAPAASADQMYEASLQQLQRGSFSTARSGFYELLKNYPTHERVPDALYYVGQSFATENADSAKYYYEQVVANYATSPRAAAAMYNLGRLAEQRKDTAAAREAYQKVQKQYPNSDEAALARDRLKALGR